MDTRRHAVVVVAVTAAIAAAAQGTSMFCSNSLCSVRVHEPSLRVILSRASYLQMKTYIITSPDGQIWEPSLVSNDVMDADGQHSAFHVTDERQGQRGHYMVRKPQSQLGPVWRAFCPSPDISHRNTLRALLKFLSMFLQFASPCRFVSPVAYQEIVFF